ncbi:MAG: hypothetical protein ACYCSF_04525 [Acidimicrobiales bacterium]
MAKYRNYWAYSIGCFLVWAVLVAVVVAKGNKDATRNILLVFGGWSIAWVSTTIARFVYPPPKRWLTAHSDALIRAVPDNGRPVESDP